MAKRGEVIDLGILDSATTETVAKPTLGEALYAQRIHAGLVDVEEGDQTFTAGVKTALAELGGQGGKYPNLGHLENINSEVSQLSVNLGYEGELTVGALEDGIRFYQRRTVESCLELGKRLLLLKELTPHGEFNERVERLGFARQTAHRFMQAAAKTSKSENLQLLSDRAKNVSAFLELITHDDDTLSELVELDEFDTMSASQLREKLRSIADEEGEELKSANRRINNMNVEIERLENQVERLSKGRERLTAFTERTEDIRQECLALQLGAELHLNGLKALFESVCSEDPSAPELSLQVEQIWITAHAAAARALDVVAVLHEITIFEDMPSRALSQHILTPEEAQRWLHDYPMIESRYEAEKAAREEKREAAKPKGRGRPKGSTNKAEK